MGWDWALRGTATNDIKTEASSFRMIFLLRDALTV
jgi:hypothetical protein